MHPSCVTAGTCPSFVSQQGTSHSHLLLKESEPMLWQGSLPHSWGCSGMLQPRLLGVIYSPSGALLQTQHMDPVQACRSLNCLSSPWVGVSAGMYLYQLQTFAWRLDWHQHLCLLGTYPICPCRPDGLGSN